MKSRGKDLHRGQPLIYLLAWSLLPEIWNVWGKVEFIPSINMSYSFSLVSLSELTLFDQELGSQSYGTNVPSNVMLKIIFAFVVLNLLICLLIPFFWKAQNAEGMCRGTHQKKLLVSSGE